jgi:hypothetical protein
MHYTQTFFSVRINFYLLRRTTLTGISIIVVVSNLKVTFFRVVYVLLIHTIVRDIANINIIIYNCELIYS